MRQINILTENDCRPELGLLNNFQHLIINFQPKLVKKLASYKHTFFMHSVVTYSLNISHSRDQIVLGLPAGQNSSLFENIEKIQIYNAYQLPNLEYLFLLFKSSDKAACTDNSYALAIPMPATILNKMLDRGSFNAVGINDSQQIITEDSRQISIEIRQSNEMFWEPK